MKVSPENLSTCLKISTEFLLQENSIEVLNSTKNYHGYTLLHLAVWNNDVEKVKELLQKGFKLYNCDSNFIPDLPVDKSKSDLEQFGNLFIPFNTKGYSPLHLCVYLFNLYQSQIKYSQKFSNYATAQQNIFSLFAEYNEEINILDNDNFSFGDYCLILKDTNLLFFLNQDACTYVSYLSFIKLTTANKILESMLAHSLGLNSDYFIKLNTFNEEILNQIQHNNLEKKVPQKINMAKHKKI